LFFLCAFLFALVALVPLRLAIGWLALDKRGFAARDAAGSIWLGALSEAQLGPVPLGDLSARLRTLPLFVGRARIDLKRAGDENPFSGALSVSRHSFGIEDVSAALETGPAFAPLPVASLELGDLSIRFADGLCAVADGLVKATFGPDISGVTLPRSLSGNARCTDGALQLPLASQTGLERLDIRIRADGSYRANLILTSADPAARDRLIAGGFAQEGSGYVLRLTGRL
jgi:general secretion pathway protein N